MDKRGNLVIVVVGLISICCLVDNDPDTSIVYHKCNKDYDVNAIYFMFCRKMMLDSLPEDMEDHGYNWYTALSEGIVPCFGHGACYRGFSRDDCISCLRMAADDVNRENCQWNMGAQFQLVDYKLRYKKYEFKED